ncbi:MAG: APC family permease [Fusobacteriaceae bacterium]
MNMDKKEGRYGFPVALSTVVGIVIGIGIFFKAKPVLAAAGGNPKLAIAAWIIGGVIAILSGLTAAEVGAAIPETGGMIAWIRKLYGDKIGFLVGWAQTFIYTSGLIAVLAYYFAEFAFAYLGIEGENLKYTVAILATLFLYVMNIYTKKGGGYIQTITTVIKLIPLVAIIVFGMLSNNNPEPMIMSEAVATATSGNTLHLLGLALVPVMFAFDGWILVGAIAGDLKNVKKTLPRAIVIGVGFVAVCYAFLNIAIFKVFPAETIMTQSGLGDIAAFLFGESSGKLILLGITISAFGGLNGNILISSKIPHALAVEGHFPKAEYFSKIDEKHEQPLRSAWMMCLVSVTYLFVMWAMKDPDTLSNIPVALFFFFYLLVFFGVFVLRKKYPEIERPYTVPMYPVVPILAIVGGIYIVYSAIKGGPTYMVVAIAITLTGLFFYKK